MLRVKILESRQVVVGYTVEGHAGYARSGRDIVCAGVSAIAQAAFMVLVESLGDRVRYELREGFISVLLGRDDALDPGPASVLRTVEQGLQSIARTHPKSVEVLRVEVGYQ